MSDHGPVVNKQPTGEPEGLPSDDLRRGPLHRGAVPYVRRSAQASGKVIPNPGLVTRRRKGAKSGVIYYGPPAVRRAVGPAHARTATPARPSPTASTALPPPPAPSPAAAAASLAAEERAERAGREALAVLQAPPNRGLFHRIMRWPS